MLNFPRWKISLIIAIWITSLFVAMPSILSDRLTSFLPSWIAKTKINLGLDLSGGSQLLLEIDSNSYIHQQLANYKSEIANQLQKQSIRAELKASSLAINITLLTQNSKDALKKIIADISNGELSLTTLENNEFSIAFEKNALQKLKKSLAEQSIEIVRRRIDETGTKEPSIQMQGENKVLLQVPGLENPEQLKSLLGATAKMTFHFLSEERDIGLGFTPGVVMMKGRSEEGGVATYPIKEESVLSGDLLTDARTTYYEGKPAVNFKFNQIGARKFADLTRDNIGKPFAIVLDGEVITAPRINGEIAGGSGVISGNFTTDEANKLALLLRAGALPAPLKVVEERTVGPSLGSDSIALGKKAAVIGVSLVMVFMFISYGIFGIFASIGVVVNVTLLFAALAVLGATLTLPGIAGIVLTVGMAVDANVLIFERIREEMRIGTHKVIPSIEAGFTQAFRTILDSNITTLLVASVLYGFGTGAVRGFAVTLIIGIIFSLFSSIIFVRMLIAIWLKAKRPKLLPI